VQRTSRVRGGISQDIVGDGGGIEAVQRFSTRLRSAAPATSWRSNSLPLIQAEYDYPDVAECHLLEDAGRDSSSTRFSVGLPAFQQNG